MNVLAQKPCETPREVGVVLQSEAWFLKRLIQTPSAPAVFPWPSCQHPGLHLPAGMAMASGLPLLPPPSGLLSHLFLTGFWKNNPRVSAV